MMRAWIMGLLIGCSPLAGLPAQACVICIAMPKESLADRIIGADLVAILREDPGQPFRYAVTVVLAGAADGVPPPPFLVDSVMRGRLAADTEGGVLATWTASSGWMLHGHASRALLDVAPRVIARSDEWLGTASQIKRFEFFAPLHAASDPDVREMALIEIARLPYAMLRQVRPGFGRQQVARQIRDAKMAEWVPIHILILGQTEDPQDMAFVRSAAQAALRPGNRRDLAAWITAWIEVDGTDAIRTILRALEADTTMPDRDVLAIALGLAEQATGGGVAVASAARSALHDIAVQRPAASAIAARALLSVGDWSAADTLARHFAGGAIREPSEVYVVRAYLAGASDAAGSSSPKADPDPGN